MNEQGNTIILAFRMEKRGHKARNIDDLLKLEKTRKWILP
jgi:hypothetical protein